MSCGHAFLHYATHCKTARSTGWSCPNVQGPTQNLEDTCAECHPSFRMAEINQQHDDLRGKLMEKLRTAGSKQEVAELQVAIEESHAERGKELRAASRVRWGGIVIWGPPGFEGEQREECE